MDAVLMNQPLVLDNGSGEIKAGFAGAEHPQLFFPSLVGRPKHARVMAGALEDDVFIGPAATAHRGLLKLKHPIEHGVVVDWADMERVWNYVYTHGLHMQSEDHPVLVTEAPLNPRQNRGRMAEIFFETFNVPAFFVSIQAVLALYASGRTTGLILDAGDGVCHSVPIYEGFAISNATRRIDVAGRDVTQELTTLLRKHAGIAMHTSAEQEIVRNIKERMCYVALDLRKEEREARKADRRGQPPSASSTEDYTLPDGTILHLGLERFRAPEVLFDPSILGLEYLGLPDMLADCVAKIDVDIRPFMHQNIVLSGGSTLLRGFGERLFAEMKTRVNKDVKIKIYSPPERKYSTWIGGSILAGLSTFRKMWVSLEDWHENPDLINIKCI